MFRAPLAVFLICVSLVIPSMSTAADMPEHIPLEDFFRNPERGYFRLSDDGAQLGFMMPVSIDGAPARMNIFVQAIVEGQPSGEPRRLTAETARDIGNFFWKGSNTVLYQKDFGGDENFHVVAVQADSGAVLDLTPFPDVRASIEDDLPDDPDHVLISHNQRDPKVFDVYRVDVRTGAAALVAENPGNIVGWGTDHAGRVRVAIASEGLDTILLYRDREDTPFKPLIKTDYRTSVSPVFFTSDDRKLYAISNRNRDRSSLVMLDPAVPDEEQLIFEPPQVDLDGASYSRKRKVLTMASYEIAKPERKIFDPQTQVLYDKLSTLLPGYEFTLQSWNRNEDMFIVAAYNDRTPGTRYLYSEKHDSLHKLADINPSLREADMASVRPISYESRDGLMIHGYLTLPPGRDPKDLACVVNPHGGPWVRDEWGYNPEAQFLANRGFCVLQMNFRGSTGYGRKFWEAGFGQWGLKMQDDITDGVHWLIDQGIADPQRIGIYGASYGGYATLAGVTFTPDLYAAAVDYVGVSNLFTFMETIPPYWQPMLVQMRDMVGDPQRDEARLAATSPALHVDRIKTPLFIAQGARDPRVNKAESDQVVDALRSRGVQVEYMVKDNEGHGFHNEENRFDFYRAMEAFLIRHLRP